MSKRLSANSNVDANRTKFEKCQVLKAPIALELEIAGQLMVDIIKKAPPQLRPAALEAAQRQIDGFEGMAKALVEQFPNVPHSFTNQLIERQAGLVREYVRNHAIG